MKRLLATAITVLAVAAGCAPDRMVRAGGAGDEDAPSSAIDDVVVELDRGQDRDIAAYFIFDKLDIPDDERCTGRAPCRQVYEFEWALNGLWLRLTPMERLEAQDLIGEFGIVSVAASARMALPVEPFEFADMTGRGYDYTPQIQDAGYRRINGAPGDYSNVTIGVIDTGVDMLHDDLNVVGGYDCTFNDAGQHGEGGSWGVDDHGHGTNVAGLAAAIDNDRGTIGPAAGAQIRSYKVFGAGASATSAQVLCGVDQATRDAEANLLDAANMSLGGQSDPSRCGGTDPYHNGICLLANLIPVVVSAGNDSIDSVYKAPASYPEVITVSALTDFDGAPGRLGFPWPGCMFAGEDDALAPFSNYGSAVDFIAPGVCTFAPLPGNQYGYLSGTSMATPYVTGVFAAYISECGAEGAREAITAWSSSNDGWARESEWTGDIGPDQEPLIRAGAPCGRL